jgi:lysozyme family protein
MPGLIKKPELLDVFNSQGAEPALEQLLPPAAPLPDLPAVASAPIQDSESANALFGGMFDSPAVEAAPAPAETVAAPQPVSHVEEVRARSRPGSMLPEVYAANEKKLSEIHPDLTKEQQADVNLFLARYKKNAEHYEKLAHQAHVPPELIAALHWREADGQFDRYLHQGDKLGRKARNEPTDIPLFGKDQFDQAAVHAIGRFGKTRDALGLTEDSNDMAAMATYAEYYNGLGYYNNGHTNPYVFSGTDQYKGGKYVADHKYDPKAKDQQVGVVALIDALKHDPDLQKRAAEKHQHEHQ